MSRCLRMRKNNNELWMRLKIQNKVYVQNPVKSNGHERLVIFGSLTPNNYRVIYYQIYLLYDHLFSDN
jgi:hypothetical protein